jgi:hypothetical protein
MLFFGTNYFAHVATLVERPGQTLPETLVNSANALFIPASGAIHALRLLILRSTTKRGNPLRNAAKAGALCMLVSKSDLRHVMDRSRSHRNTWLTRNFENPTITEPEFLEKYMHSNILGRAKFNKDRYTLMPVPPDVPLKAYCPVVPPDKEETGLSPNKIRVQPSYNVAGALIALVQVIWGIVTLYNVRANQIDLYGYGAFGLTVIPYALMSFVNLMTNLLRPGYHHLYLVHTPDMDKAAGEVGRSAGSFAGMIAAVDIEALDNQPERVELVFDVWIDPKLAAPYLVGYILFGLIPIVVVAGLTRFRAGTDIRQERAWILAWLIVGAVAPLYVVVSANFAKKQHRGLLRYPTQVIMVLPLWVPAIGGMVIVGKTLTDFGICSRLD